LWKNDAALMQEAMVSQMKTGIQNSIMRETLLMLWDPSNADHPISAHSAAQQCTLLRGRLSMRVQQPLRWYEPDHQSIK
jgi:hypothetical protein